MPRLQRFTAICLALFLCQTVISAEPPLTPAQTQQLTKTLEDRLEQLTRKLQDEGPSLQLYSQRGDVLFFLGRFEAAVADYDQMLPLDERLKASHWRRGLALYYAGKFAEAAEQFERFYEIDKVDRENGIWHYLSLCRMVGPEPARRRMLPYEQADREPFGDIYRLFAGTTTSEAMLERIESARIEPADRDLRLFYAHLYSGLNELTLGKTDAARASLREAVASTAPRQAGYGPHYMWQVARLQYELLPMPPGGSPIP